MRFLHHNLVFEILDDWWEEAGMNGFVPYRTSYDVDREAFPGRRVYEVRIDEVAPVRRQLSHGVFNDDADTGRAAKDRVLSILRGFVSGAAIPPVEVIRLQVDAGHACKLKHGAHRFYCSLAAGFTHVPAVCDDRRGNEAGG